MLFSLTSCNREQTETTSDWFAFQPANTMEPAVVGMKDWLDPPAGKHGFLTIEGDDFVFEDGTRIKFWGTNHGNRNCGPGKEEAEKRAGWLPGMRSGITGKTEQTD